MKKYTIFIVSFLVFFALVVAWKGGYFEPAVDTSPSDYKNATYKIEGVDVALTNGISEIEGAPGSASKITTRYFGNEANGDLNADGTEDIAFLLTQNSGGSGTFYYAVVAINTEGGYKGTNAILLGDRVAPQTTEIRNGFVVVNYADRKSGEPMTARPTEGKSKYLEIKNGQLAETPIFVASPTIGSAVSSPLAISGVARGFWFFEASFPIAVVDQSGKTLTTGIATAQGEWMTTNYVPFTATLKWTNQKSGEKGTLIFKKDNPSGLPEHDDSRSIEIIFK